MRVGSMLAMGALIMLAGCDQDDQVVANQADTSPAAATGQALAVDNGGDVAVNAAETDGGGSDRYTCDNDIGVVVTYGDNSVALLINGLEYELPSVASASGTKYRSDAGLSPGKSLAWWSKGNEAMLIEAPLGDKTGNKDEVAKCRKSG